MSDHSAIEWTESTWNPVTGCSKVSPGCAHCYAESLSLRYGWSKSAWTPENADENVVLHSERLDQPRTWRKPRLVFVNSMSDLFHERVPWAFVAQVFAVMGETPRHTFQVLTKRPARMRDFVRTYYDGVAPYPNVWLGVSVENQHWADERIPLLLETPAAVRFLSCEPLLGPVSLDRWLWRQEEHVDVFHATREMAIDAGDPSYEGYPIEERSEEIVFDPRIDWVIVGGESGPRARPVDPEWVRSIRRQVGGAVPFFFKQWGGRTPKAGGRELDGRTWDEMPATAREAVPA